MFLERIVKTKREEIDRLNFSSVEEKKAREMPPCRSLRAAISGDLPILIAEIKPASPSKGQIRRNVDPLSLALQYERGGASAISVLTDVQYFGGRLSSLKEVKEAVSIPVLRKDFILDPLQIIESRLHGADAILVIAALLSSQKLKELTAFAQELGLEVLIEVHREEEVLPALEAGPDVLGINNRDLYTFVTDTQVTEKLLPLIPDTTLVISESGIHSSSDLQRVLAAGAKGALVGEYLMRQPSPEEGVRSLLTGVEVL